MTAAATDKQRLVDAALTGRGHRSLGRMVAAARRKDPPVAWEPLAATITQLSGEYVTGEALRRWYGAKADGGAA